MKHEWKFTEIMIMFIFQSQSISIGVSCHDITTNLRVVIEVIFVNLIASLRLIWARMYLYCNLFGNTFLCELKEELISKRLVYNDISLLGIK